MENLRIQKMMAIEAFEDTFEVNATPLIKADRLMDDDVPFSKLMDRLTIEAVRLATGVDLGPAEGTFKVETNGMALANEIWKTELGCDVQYLIGDHTKYEEAMKAKYGVAFGSYDSAATVARLLQKQTGKKLVVVAILSI